MENKFSVSEMSALELVAINSPNSDENTCNRQSMCQQTVPRVQILLGITFSYSLSLKLMEELYDTGSVQISAVFWVLLTCYLPKRCMKDGLLDI